MKGPPIWPNDIVYSPPIDHYLIAAQPHRFNSNMH